MRFPSPILVPDHVHQTRKERLQQLVTSCSRGIAIRSIIILAELIGFVLFNSSALMLDALASLTDVVASILLIISLKFAARPPDENHPFGHGRFEPLIGLQMGLFIVLIGGGMLLQQVLALNKIPEHQPISGYAWTIPLAAVILLEICYQTVMQIAKRQHSPALATDAIHYRIDGITSLCAAIALIAGAYYPEWSLTLDHSGAIGIALLMIGMGVYALRENLHQIMDKIPSYDHFERVRLAAKRVEGVHETEKIRIQQYGPDAHVDIDIEVDPLLSVEVAHVISQKVRAEIQKEWPFVRDVTVHIEPFYPNDH